MKYEELLRNEYRDLADARSSIREFVEKVHNHKRRRSALGSLPRSVRKGSRCAHISL